MNELIEKKCKACEGGVEPLSEKEVQYYLKKLEGWKVNEQNTEIDCMFAFKNYYQTMAFVNAVAYMAHCENHHPDLEVAYNRCRVRYSTHAIGGLSENDFICAAKVDRIIAMKHTA
jgi:4a-hydroxytetrahydrobiopterin dehydratase